MPPDRTRYFTPLQVAERTGLAVGTIQGAIQAYRLRAQRGVNGRCTVTLEDLKEWQKEKRKTRKAKTKAAS